MSRGTIVRPQEPWRRSRFAAVSIAVLSQAALAPPARSSPVGGNFEISGGGCRFPDAAHAIAAGKYLVVWADYNETRVHARWVTESGAVDGTPFRITEAPYGGLFPAVAYDAADDELLVTWDDFGGRGEVIHGQRVRAADGALAGVNFAIGSVAGGIRSAVAWSATSNVYLVVYFVPGAAAEIHGQRVSGAGALLGGNVNISADGTFSGYPSVSWGEMGDQFLVAWDNDDGNIHARRVAAATGALLGTPIIVTAGGAKDRSCVAYDAPGRRWLVQYNDGANAGFSYDQFGRLVNTQGVLEGAPLSLAHSPAFEGDTQFGGDVAFAPAAGRFFSSFGTDSGMGAQESSSTGAPVGPQIVIGTGFYTSLNNAADTRHNRFLTVWEGLEGTYRIYGQVYGATLAPPAALTVESREASNFVSWQNPDEPHFTGTLVRFKRDGYPAGPEDGEPVADRSNAPGSADGFLHSGLTDWETYYYSAFAHDGGPNYSLAAQAAGTPRPPTVTVLLSEFNAGADGWALVPWRAGTLSPGTVAWDAAGRNVIAAGSGASNNLDTCTREGGILTRAISTAGRRGIQIEYDVMASLHAPPTTSGGGNCAVLEGGIEDKLVVSYSTAGTGGPWTVAEVLSEGIELPTGWTRRLINLAGIADADDNPGFALRFQWQFNNERDTGRLDAIRVLSGAVTGPTPAVGLFPARLERTVQAGGDLPADSLFVANTGEGVLAFTVSEDLPWLGVSPAAGSSAGPRRRLEIDYQASGLPLGDHEGSIEVASAAAGNSPQAVAIVLHVVPPACLREEFRYYDGELTTMGGASWSGGAASRIVVEGETLGVLGGGGAESAARAVACPDAGPVITVRLKVQGGAGTGDFFWNLAIDDDSGDTAGGNLARWYGGSTIVRGRIGGAITGDLVLSGAGAWDDLTVKIDTAANTSEFFFNGVSRGTIAHGTGPTNRIGSIRIERFDRAGTGGDSLRFDDLVVEGAARRVFHRADPDGSGATSVADALVILRFLFARGAVPACLESADVDNGGQIDIGDAIGIIFFLFGGGPAAGPLAPPGPPGSPCGPDPDAPRSAGDLGCRSYDPCASPP